MNDQWFMETKLKGCTSCECKYNNELHHLCHFGEVTIVSGRCGSFEKE